MHTTKATEEPPKSFAENIGGIPKGDSRLYDRGISPSWDACDIDEHSPCDGDDAEAERAFRSNGVSALIQPGGQDLTLRPRHKARSVVDNRG